MDATRNGHTPSAREQLREARARERLLECEIRTKQLERVHKRVEARSVYEDAGFQTDWLSAYNDMLQRVRGEELAFNVTSAWDRRAGIDFPIFRTEQELSLYRMPSRIMDATNPYAQGLLRGLRAYVIGDGYTHRVTSKKDDDQHPDLCEFLQGIIDQFHESNGWFGASEEDPGAPSMEAEFFNRSIRDGDALLCHFACTGGRTEVRMQEPEHLTHAGSPWDWEIGSFGILTERLDPAKRYAYWFTWGGAPDSGEEVAADRVVHLRRGVDRIIKRGLPEWIFSTYTALDVADKLSTNLGIGGAAQASYAEIRQHDNALQANITNMQAALTDYQRTNLTTGRTDNFSKTPSGRRVDVPKGMVWVDPPAYKSPEGFVVILHALLRKAGQRWNAPEWLATSSGADMAAYTASLTSESPFVRSVQAEQRQYKACYCRSDWIALENYVRHCGGSVTVPVRSGENRERVTERSYTWAEIKRFVDIQVEAPSPIVRDGLQEAQSNSLRVQAQLKSRQTAMQEEGLDPDREIANMREWDEVMGPELSALELPGEESESEGAGGVCRSHNEASKKKG